MNVNWFAQTPGTEEAAIGIYSHRSGLAKKRAKKEQVVDMLFCFVLFCVTTELSHIY